MPLYMDVHYGVKELDAEKVAAEHQKDLQHQGKYGVRFLRYWYDAEKGAIFCLSKAPDSTAAMAVHQDAGHPADDIFQVEEGE